MTDKRFGVSELLELMSRLRTPETGCPWDLEQDYLSITPSTIEEAYEVVDAIEREDFRHLKEELGDLLFQVVFYAQLAKEEGHFDFSSIVDALTAKLIRRHPHVFPDGTLESVRDVDSSEQEALVSKRWEQIKAEEREEKGQHGVIDDVPLALPALQRAQKLQKRVAKAGMDWRSAQAALGNLEAEISELKQALDQCDELSIEDELGDVFFSCVNLARKLNKDSDKLLRASNSKFEQRIREMERQFETDELTWSQLDDTQLDEYWSKAKRSIKLSKSKASL